MVPLCPPPGLVPGAVEHTGGIAGGGGGGLAEGRRTEASLELPALPQNP